MLYEHWFARFEDMAGDAAKPDRFPFPDTGLLCAMCKACEDAYRQWLTQALVG